MKKKGTKYQYQIDTTAPKVEMSGRKDVSIHVCVKDITEEELQNIVKIIESENSELRKKYYHSNILIKQTQQRKFSELLKTFIDIAIEKFKRRETTLNTKI